MRRNTKINHSFPQCLIKQWINNSIDKYPNALQICDKELNIKRKEAHNIFFEKNQYTQNTETQTSKDDDQFFKYIREIETTNNINEKAKIFQDISFLQLTYKLLCRTKTINETEQENARRLRQIRCFLPKKRFRHSLSLVSLEPRPEAGCQEMLCVREKMMKQNT